MSWSYDPSLPADLDKVRMLIGDTLEDDQLLSDEEVMAMIDTYNTASMAAVAACRAIAARFSRQADKWVGDLKILASQKARAFLTLADTLEARGAAALGGSMGAPMAGGISIADKEAVAGNPDRVPPSFYRGIHDNEVGET